MDDGSAGYRPFFQNVFAQINRSLKQSLQLPPLLKGSGLSNEPVGSLVERETGISGAVAPVGAPVPETPLKQRPPSADSNESDLAKEDSFDVNRCKLQPLDHGKCNSHQLLNSTWIFSKQERL